MDSTSSLRPVGPHNSLIPPDTPTEGLLRGLDTLAPRAAQQCPQTDTPGFPEVMSSLWSGETEVRILSIAVAACLEYI